MGPHALGDSSMAAITLAAQCLGPNVCKEWSRRTLNLSVQRSKVWFMSVICGLGSAEAIFAGILPVDVTAPPPVRTDCHRVAPRSFTLSTRRVRRKTSKGSDDDEGSEWIDDGGFGRIDGGFGFGGGDNGKGWSYGRDAWNSEEWGWGETGDSVFNSVYEVACWISLSHCLHYAFKKVVHLIQNGMDNSSGEAAAPFALCSSAFLQKDLVIPPMVSDDLLKHDRVSK